MSLVRIVNRFPDGVEAQCFCYHTKNENVSVFLYFFNIILSVEFTCRIFYISHLDVKLLTTYDIFGSGANVFLCFDHGFN